MTATHELSITTRFSDLDPQRHINNSYYEIYTREARYLILEQHGYDYARLIAEELYLQPLATEVFFHRQQSANTSLKVITEYEQSQEGIFRWLQKIQNSETGVVACEMEHRTRFEKKNQPYALHPPEIPLSPHPFENLKPIAGFNGSCMRSV